jgi:hypothetical protein
MYRGIPVDGKLRSVNAIICGIERVPAEVLRAPPLCKIKRELRNRMRPVARAVSILLRATVRRKFPQIAGRDGEAP